ncbi:MAG: glycosyltransferase [Anaerolineales bacterium]|nr:glycosyltransferase [Anaerolineales bacterium]
MNVIQITLAPVLIAYSLAMLVLLVYIANMTYLALTGFRERKKLSSSARPVLKELPRVTVQLPIYNEWYVAERLIEASAALDYPHELLEIQVLDDSIDDTVSLIAEKVKQVRSKGIDVVHIHREDREGFKAGALANGLEKSNGEYLAIFDADFLPKPDFLKKMLPHFDDEKVAFVQARWGHLNRNYSLLTLLQAFSLDAHFAIDQLARANTDYIFNFNGTAGIWRKSAIVDAGGWKADTLTEDMDLSYRVFLRGWSARYAGEVEVPAELPVSFTAYRRQQYRWARGSLECAVRYIPVIWNSNFSFARKFQATLHLTGYALHLLTFVLMLLYPFLLLFATKYPSLLVPAGIGLFMTFLVFAPAAYFAVAQQLLRRHWLSSLPLIFMMSIFSSGLILNTMRAALQIVQKRVVPFERTPKYAITHRTQLWHDNRYQVKIDALIFYEMMLALFNLWTAWFAWNTSHYLIMIFAFFFAAGLLFASGFTLLQALAARFIPASKPDSD